jgi:GTPase
VSTLVIMLMSNGDFRAGYVAIVGEPNVGKSTLLNALLHQKISIVTRKPQTTRQRVLGILTQEDSQVVFLDTPGLISPQYLLQEKMRQAARRALADADVILVLTEVSKGTELPAIVTEEVLGNFSSKPVILAINKVDLIDRILLLPMIDRFSQLHPIKEVVPLSALKNENVETLIPILTRFLPVHPPFYPPEMVSEHPERFFVAEFIREKIFDQFREEIPYSVAVEIREFKERSGGKSFISADILVERDSQKGILIGKKGAALKKVGEKARADIELFLGRPVFIDLHVKVRDKWRQNEQVLRRLGYTGE